MNKWCLAVVCGLAFSAQAAEYASLKHKEVNLRAGPGERYPILWIYQERNYPVEVLDSFENWRQIREKDGTIGWVHQNMLKQARHVLIETEALLLKRNDPTSNAIAVVQPGVIAKVDACPFGEYCRIIVSDETHKLKGWFPRSALWGIDKDEVFEK